MEKNIYDNVKKSEKEFIEIRHELHEYPEVGFDLQRTSDLIASKLSEWGYEVTRGLAKTGVVGTLKVGDGSKIIGIRSDMDALPIIEESGKPWSSKVPGKSHACGHDGHQTILLCAAKYLAETKNFNGTLHVIFQPAEELLYGGKVMMEDGLFQKFPCDVLYAIHNMPGLKAGELYFRTGEMMASSDTLQIEVTGKGAHGAMPELGIDAGLIACYIAVALQSIVSRNISPQAAAVVTIGEIKSGDAPNLVNEKAILSLSVRCLNADVRKTVLNNIERIATSQAQSFGASAKVNHINGSPVLINGVDATNFAIGVAKEILGSDKVHESPKFMASEDFAYMLEAHPNGCYMFIGSGDEPDRPAVHNPGYDFNDVCIVPAASLWVGLTESYLDK